MSNEELAQQSNREALWEQVKRLLYQLARRFYRRYGADCCARRGVTLEDLYQESYLAFLEAVKAYKPAGPYRFTTYLSKASESRFRACMGLRRRNPLDISDSMNAPTLDDGERTVEAGDLIPDPKAAGELEDIDTTAERDYYHTELEAGLEALEPLQEAVLRRRFYGCQTRQQIAEALQKTTADVRREESHGLQALRDNKRIQRLGDE